MREKIPGYCCKEFTSSRIFILFYKIDQTLESFFRQNHSPACFRALLSDLLEKQEILSKTEINVLLKRLTNENYLKDK